MFFITIKLLLAALVGSVVVLTLKGGTKSKEYKDCHRCEGKGYWYGTRGREECNLCRGTGQQKRKEWED